MHVKNGTSFYKVALTEDDVQDFAQRWPGFGTPQKLWYEFHKETGDLVDMSRETGDIDEAALLALSDDAQTFGLKQMASAQTPNI